MIKSLFILLFGLCAISLYAQDEDPEKKNLNPEMLISMIETIAFYDSYDEYKKRKNRHWQGLDIGINGLSYADGTDVPPAGYQFVQLDYGRSYYFGLNLFEGDIYQINGELIKILMGVGFDFNNFQLRGSSLMVNRNDSLVERADTLRNFKGSSNNNMKNAHITVPLLLAFNTSPKNTTSFHIAFGAIFSYRISGKQKVVYKYNDQSESGDLKEEVLRKSRMFQNPWRINATLRLGYGNFHVFGNYNLLHYWENGQAPSARLWTIGVKVLPW